MRLLDGFLFVLSFVELTFCSRLVVDFRNIAGYFPGVYSNENQYVNDVLDVSPSNKKHERIRYYIRPIRIKKFPKKSFNVYVEQFMNGAKSPFRRSVYSFAMDTKKMVIKMRKYNLLRSRLNRKFRNYYKLFKTLNVSHFSSRPECDLYWRLLSNRTYVAVTKRGCTASFNRKKVFKSTAMTLTPLTLQWRETWYSPKEGTNVYEMTNPYKFQKIKKFSGRRFLPPEYRKHTRRKKKGGRHSRQKVQKFMNEVLKSRPLGGIQSDQAKMSKFQEDTVKLMSVLSKLANNKRTWLLKDFAGILDAVVAGHLVRYSVDLKNCKVTGAKEQVTAFGDSIDVFQYIEDTGHHHMKFLQFSKKRVISGSKGASFQLRDVKIYPNGNVIIDISSYHRRTFSIFNHSMIHCRLYDPETRYGDIRFTTNPMRDVHMVHSYRKVLNSVNSGHTVRMTLDLSYCANVYKSRMRRVIGGGVKGYDIIGNGEKLTYSWEVLHPRRNLQGGLKLNHAYQIHTLFENNTSTFAELTDHNFNSFSQKLKLYKCKIDTPEEYGSLKLFSSPNLRSLF